jgi:hypothetical protein
MMKKILYALLASLLLSLPALAQKNIEFYGGYRHISGDQGLDGFNVGGGLFPIPRFELYLTYDNTYDNSTIGTFALTSVGSTLVNSHMQEILTGPRYFLPGVLKSHGHVEGHLLIPYIDAGFGEARLHTDVRAVNIAAAQAADTLSANSFCERRARTRPPWSQRAMERETKSNAVIADPLQVQIL